MFGRVRRSHDAAAKVRKLGDQARDRRAWSEAGGYYEQYLQFGNRTDAAQIWVQVGNMRKEAGDRGRAQQAYTRSLELDPHASDTHLQLGHLLKLVGKLPDALKSYSEAVRLDPSLGDAQDELSRLKSSLKDTDVPELATILEAHDQQSHPNHISQWITYGNVDEVKGGTIRGWALLGNKHSASKTGGVVITVAYQGRPIGQIKADRYRPDVGKHLNCDPHCGFAFTPSPRYCNGRSFALSFHVEPQHFELQGSPFQFLSPSGELRSELAGMHNVVDELSRQLWRVQRDLKKLLSVNIITLDDYDSWARRYHSALRYRRSKLPAHSASPLVSILCPVYRPRIPDFIAAVRSVIDQTYSNWELILVDDNSESYELTACIDGFCASDPRVCSFPQTTNGGISAATNIAIQAARGDYIALFDHDDLLLNVALEVMVEAALVTGAKLLYSDEDKIDDFGRYSEPNFKSDWNYRLLLGQNYICHFLVVEASTLRAVGPFDPQYDGAQDHDLVLRLSEIVEPAHIHHVPEVIYHWRKTPGSTASTIENKAYAVDAGASAVRNHLQRRGFNAAVWPMMGVTVYRTDWRFTHEPRVCIIIPFKEHIALTRRCVEMLRNNTHYGNYEVLLVDNWSLSSEAVDFRRDISKSRNVDVMVVEEPYNFSRLNNLACRRTDAEFVLFMNNDVFIEQVDWLRRLVNEAIADAKVAAVGAKLLFPDKTIQHGGVILGVGGVADHAGRGRGRDDPFYLGRGICAQEMSAVTGALMLCRRSAFDEVGGFDELDLAVAYNDIDLCLKLRQHGWKVIYVADVSAEHHESISRGDDMNSENLGRFVMEERTMLDRWKPELASDPFYNPNFSQDGGIFEELSTKPLNSLI